MSDYEVDQSDELLMHTYATLPANCKKYWRKRFQIFSKFEQGIFLSSELWFSVTPEAVAVFTAKLVALLLPDATSILDLCCGGGGNTIQFAQRFECVGAVDINPTNVKCTMHNATIYGVQDKIWNHTQDWNAVAGTEWIPAHLRRESIENSFDFVFCLPPWGGPSYSNDTFDLYGMEPFALDRLCFLIRRYCRNFGLFLPRSLDLGQLSQVAREMDENGVCRVVYVYEDGHLVGLLALFGPDMGKDIDYESFLPAYEE